MKADVVEAKTKHEFIVGLVVVLSFIILSVFVLMVSGISTVLKPGYNLFVYYDYIHGVSTGSLVKYAGVTAGEIVGMEVVYNESVERPKIRVKIFLNNWVEVREKSSIYVRGSTPLSEPHLEIICRGTPDGERLKDGDRVDGINPTPIEDLVANAEVIAQQLKETVTKVNALLGDPNVGADVRAMLHNLAELTGTLNEIIKKNEGNIGNSLDRFNHVMNELEALVVRVKQGEGSLGRLVSDQELYDEMLAFVREIKAHPWRLMKKDGGRKFLLF